VGRARDAAADRLQLRFVEHWHLQDGYLDLLAGRVRAAIRSLPAPVRGRADVMFTAHSLPVRILAEGDPYPQQLRETAEAVAERLDLERWSIAWQSAGRTSEQWIGPDILEVLRDLAANDSSAVVVCPAGFTADHLETLYDLDIEARTLAAELGLAWRRTRSLNADPAFLRVLARLVRERCTAIVA
jgi:protoporphyrin/coproporphyrin ferrochelatase